MEVDTASRTLAVTGFGFDATSVVQVGGADRPTTFVNAQSLRVELSAADVDAPATLTLSVRGPGAQLASTTVRVVANLYRTSLPLLRR